ncbi:MAG: thermonuclease family protein [Alphaproteobacteria bacterium]|nr:MAG: thermonuclease family protein [Alphaproteobacteria bacterium]
MQKLALMAVMLVAAFDAHASEPRVCLVVGVSDGDTITARCGSQGAFDQVKVRIGAIDAPEKAQPFGQRSKQAMSGLTFGKEVRLECSKTDRYRRSVCSVWVAPSSAPDGPRTLDAGLAMVSVGMAWWYREYSSEQTAQARGQYEFAEREAQTRRAGLWLDAEPTAPWDWRQLRRQGAVHE